jgi:hypothetical protein
VSVGKKDFKKEGLWERGIEGKGAVGKTDCKKGLWDIRTVGKKVRNGGL